MNLALNLLSLAFLALAGVAFARRYRGILAITGVLFFPVCTAALLTGWWELSPLLAIFLVVCTLGISLLTLCLLAIDVTWAPFCLEMTYPSLLCWILCPSAVILGYVGALLRWLFTA